jgi:thymidine phosphorylase
MDTPLGHACGNAIEVAETIETLHGRGPADLVEITLALADEMLALAGIDASPEEALASGAAERVWMELVRAQGGDLGAGLPTPLTTQVVRAPAAGYITRLDALGVGVCAWRLGAGRSRKEDPVSASAGVVCLAKPGDRVEEGQAVLELHIDDGGRVPHALEALDGAIDIGPEPPPPRQLVIEVIRG